MVGVKNNLCDMDIFYYQEKSEKFNGVTFTGSVIKNKQGELKKVKSIHTDIEPFDGEYMKVSDFVQ